MRGRPPAWTPRWRPVAEAPEALRLSGVSKSFNAGTRAEAGALLEKVGLSRWRDTRVNNLSGGQAQRVAIVRALAMNPVLVLADEPTGNLDTAAADGVFALLREINA